MKKIFLFLGIVSLLNADIAIKDAWQKVLNVNEGLKASQAEVDHAYQLSESTSSMYLPVISIGGSYTRMQKDLEMDIHTPATSFGPITIPSQAINLPLQDQDVFMSSLSVLWPIYTGGKIDAANDVYASKQVEAKAKHHMEKDKTFLKLIKVYYGVVISESLLNTRQEAQNALAHHYENAKKT